MDDQQLIQQYVAEHSEQAFQELVRRHLGLVYATALRRLNGDSHLAEDVAQLVFTNLARKAQRLPAGVVLAGWLHRDTCFTSLEIIRRERRRQIREHTASAMQVPDTSPPSPDWEQIGPILDEALDQLPEKDRDALLLRFFEGRSLLEIGEKLGFGESGASRRVTRALEKLRSVLERRGVVTSTAALSAVLAVQAGQAAQLVPAALASAVSAASLSASATSAVTTTGTLLTMATIKAKIGIAAVIGLAILTPVAVKLHSRTNQNTEEEYRRLEREHLSEAAQHILPLIVYAGDNTNRLPETLDEVGLLDDRFELVHKGLLPTDTNVAPTTIILREKQAWRTPRGTWAKAYGYADGHSQLGTSTDGDFSAWESRQSATGRLAASRAEVEPRPAPRP